MKLHYTLLAGLIALTVGGCAGSMPQPLSTVHPANPAAPEATYPPAIPALMQATNLAQNSPTETRLPLDFGNVHRISSKSKHDDEHNHNASPR